jgi:xylulokinase
MIDRILVLDVGSSSLKAVLFRRDGTIAAAAEASYSPQPSAHRQDPETWWSAVRTAIARLGAPRIDAIALTGTMENLIAVDPAGRPLCDAILYSDPCGGEALAAAAPALEAIGAAKIVGNEPEPLMTAFKIGWLRQTSPKIFAEAAFFLPGAKDALALRLTGRAVTDAVTATTTGLMHLARRQWSEPIAAALGIPLPKLPEILPATALIGSVLSAAAADLGLEPRHETLVVNGCGDVGATTLGSFCRVWGDLSLYLGTTGWLARVVDAAEAGAFRPVYRLAHPSPGLLIEVTPILSAGAAAMWARGIFGLSEAAAEQALRTIDAEPPDIVFLPYLAGERFPFMDAEVRGAFLGLGAGHGPAALYYSVLEGVGFAIRANLGAVDPSGAARIRLAGGGARSAIWPKMLADIVARRLSVPESAPIATSHGAFLVAAETFGLPISEAGTMREFEPRGERRPRTERLAAAFASATDFARSVKLHPAAAGSAADE